MKLKRPLMLAGAITSLGLAGLVGVRAVSAASNTSSGGLASRIAQKFNLKESDVQSVVDEQRSETMAKRMEERKAALDKRLQQAVDDGKLTADQKNALETKLEDRMAKRQQEREEMRTWADEQGIDLSQILPEGHGGHEGFGGPF